MAGEAGGYEVAIGGYRFDPLDATERDPAPSPAAGLPGGDDLPPPPRVPDDLDESAADPDAWLVQLHRTPTPDEVARLRATHGLALDQPVPELAFLERIDVDTAERVRGDDLVRAVAPYRAAYKLAPTLGRIATFGRAGPAASLETGEREGAGDLVDAILFDDGDPDTVAGRCRDLGARDPLVLDDRAIGGRARVRVTLDTPDVAVRMATIPDVRWIEPVAAIKPDNVNAATTIQSGTAGISPIWNVGLRGEGQIIGVMDNGPLDINHCFFVDNANNAPRPAHRKVVGLRNANGDASGGHATFVAGCAAGDDVNNAGAAARRGGAFNAKLHVANNQDLGGATLLAELNAAATAGARIHSNSWHASPQGAGNPATYDQFSADVDSFTFNNEDNVVLGSSGNNGEEQGPPGTAKNAICVSAAQADPNEMTIGDGNAGPTADGRRKPDIVTVGCSIQSATNGTPCSTGPRSACATSYATPHAAAAAALIRQYFTEGWYPSGEQRDGNRRTPTGALIKAVLVNSCVDMTGPPGYPSTTEGWGLVQLNRALFFEGGARRLKVFDVRHADGLATGGEATHRVDVEADTEELRVVLAYYDAPGTAGAVAPTVNNLNLEVTTPDGSDTFLGNRLVNGFSATGGAVDPMNTVEVVRVQTPDTGRWTVTVRAPTVTTGNPTGQGYAVAVTGALAQSNCFVATSVYGDPYHPDVDALRDWRDRHTAPRAPWRPAVAALDRLYRRVGPWLARRIARHPGLVRTIRVRALAPLAAVVRRGSAHERRGR